MVRRFWIALAILPFLSIAIAHAQSVDDIVAKHIAARGGADKIKALKTLKMSGKALIQGGAITAAATLQQMRPDALRIEIGLQGKSLIQAFDGTDAWMSNPFAGDPIPTKMSAEDAKDFRQQADFDGPLFDYKAKGNTIELVGKEDFEGSPVYKLKVTLKDGGITYTYIDADSYLILKETTRRKREGSEIEIEILSSDYKPVNGVLFAHSIESRFGGQTAYQLSIDTIEVNTGVDASAFKMAAPAK